MYLLFIHRPLLTTPETCDKGERGVFNYVNEGGSVSHPRVGAVCHEDPSCEGRGGTLSPNPLSLQGGERGRRSNQLHMANNLISYANIIKPP